MPFEPRSQRLLTAAQGFLKLGLPLDADAEIESRDADVRHLPEVLAVRVGIFRALNAWPPMQVVARQLALYDPNEPDWTVASASATPRAESLDAARLILVNAVERLPGVTVFAYNLACYEAQLGDIASAKTHRSRASAMALRCVSVQITGIPFEVSFDVCFVGTAATQAHENDDTDADPIAWRVSSEP